MQRMILLQNQNVTRRNSRCYSESNNQQQLIIPDTPELSVEYRPIDNSTRRNSITSISSLDIRYNKDSNCIVHPIIDILQTLQFAEAGDYNIDDFENLCTAL